MKLLHTPYDGSSKPFTIGLNQLDLADWIEVDDRLGVYLRHKDRLMISHPGQVWAAEANSLDAQREVLTLLVDHLTSHFPDVYEKKGQEIIIVPHERQTRLDTDVPSLISAARLIAEDLVIMQRDDQGWCLTAASLCFPSNWSLLEKFGLPLQDIHQPVPGFGQGTRNAAMIGRIFDHLKPEQPVKRWNWSVMGDDELFHPSHQAFEGAPTHIRVEVQTLRKLPQSGAILFTIGIHIDQIKYLIEEKAHRNLAKSLSSQLEELSPVQRRYKNLSDETLKVLLDQLAGQPGG